MACLFEEEAPTVKETVNIYPTIDVDDDEENYVDVLPDDESVILQTTKNKGFVFTSIRTEQENNMFIDVFLIC